MSSLTHQKPRPSRSSRRAARRAAAALALAMLLALATAVPALAQCAMCEGSAAAGSDAGVAYNRSTLFMLSVPYLLLGGIGGYVVYVFRRGRSSAQDTSEDEAPIEEEDRD